MVNLPFNFLRDGLSTQHLVGGLQQGAADLPGVGADFRQRGVSVPGEGRLQADARQQAVVVGLAADDVPQSIVDAAIDARQCCWRIARAINARQASSSVRLAQRL
jgi:hypothetical protein